MSAGGQSRAACALTRAAPPALLVLLTAGLGGCFGGGFHSNQPLQQQYLLSWSGPSGGSGRTSAPAAAAPLDPARSLEVLLPTAAPGLEGEGIAVLRPGAQLDYYNGARWASSVPQMLQTLAIEALREQGRFALVESDSAPFAAGWELQLELTHFEADDSSEGPPTVRVGFIATLGERRTRRAVMTLSADTQAVAQADRMRSVVAAFQSATDAALGQIAARLAPLAAPAPASPPR